MNQQSAVSASYVKFLLFAVLGDNIQDFFSFLVLLEASITKGAHTGFSKEISHHKFYRWIIHNNNTVNQKNQERKQKDHGGRHI